MGFAIRLRSKGDWSRTKRFLQKMMDREPMKVLDECGRRGVAALASATPKNSGRTADCWRYYIEGTGDRTRIVWENTNVQDGWFNVAVGLQYGHGTGTGGYVQGIDYINPAIRPVFDDIAETVWKVVVSS